MRIGCTRLFLTSTAVAIGLAVLPACSFDSFDTSPSKEGDASIIVYDRSESKLRDDGPGASPSTSQESDSSVDANSGQPTTDNTIEAPITDVSQGVRPMEGTPQAPSELESEMSGSDDEVSGEKTSEPVESGDQNGGTQFTDVQGEEEKLN